MPILLMLTRTRSQNPSVVMQSAVYQVTAAKVVNLEKYMAACTEIGRFHNTGTTAQRSASPVVHLVRWS